LADALDSGSSGGNLVGVQVPSAAPKKTNLFFNLVKMVCLFLCPKTNI